MLNDQLYLLLKQRFGEVRVANEGEELVGRYLYDPISDKTVLEIDARGETYCINCPWCNDTRQRLYVNHRYGVYDNITESDNTTLVRCFNEDCFKTEHNRNLYSEFRLRLFAFLNVSQRGTFTLSRSRSACATRQLTNQTLPGQCIPLRDLPRGHFVSEFLLSRGFNPSEISNDFEAQYCTRTDNRYRLAEGRIIIPIKMNNMLVGWQARFPGNLNWKQARIPKYYTLPAMPKRLVLYNYDSAKTQPFGIVVEGPTSAWTCKPYGLALLGKQATIQQQRLLIEAFKDKPLILLLDPDAEADAIRLEKLLKPYMKAGLARIKLPDSRDPADYQTSVEELWSIIHTQASEQGVTIEKGCSVGC